MKVTLSHAAMTSGPLELKTVVHLMFWIMIILTQRNQPVVRKLTPKNNNVLLRTSAVRVINPSSGKSVLAYAQHDSASQATLISERLKNELDLNVDTKSAVTIRTLADQTILKVVALQSLFYSHSLLMKSSKSKRLLLYRSLRMMNAPFLTL